ncbi:hypothetical protein Barb4_04744 [Bacteroidales bacterium Barb4]|nr:hypothetical protein Barb4_04744 [Bacteroidales bacterium Barb4]
MPKKLPLTVCSRKYMQDTDLYNCSLNTNPDSKEKQARGKMGYFLNFNKGINTRGFHWVALSVNPTFRCAPCVAEIFCPFRVIRVT